MLGRTPGTQGLVFGHEAMMYHGRMDFVRQTIPFIRDALVAEQPILVAVDQSKIDELRISLGTDATRVRFEDMVAIGRNPARIIPVWRSFVEAHAGNERGLRGIGEPIWAGRSSDELVECERHEALLNLAFASPAAALHLVCPYDAGSLSTAVIDEARRNHPDVVEDGASVPSADYVGRDAIAGAVDAPLAPPQEIPVEMRFSREGELPALRAFVWARASERGVASERINDVVLAVDETVTNSIRHGGGGGVLRAWSQDGEMIFEVADQGLIDQPLVGRLTPDPNEPGGFGLWLANQLCDLVQIRSSPPHGSLVRLHVAMT